MKLSHSIVLRQIFVQIFIIHIYNEDKIIPRRLKSRKLSFQQTTKIRYTLNYVTYALMENYLEL